MTLDCREVRRLARKEGLLESYFNEVSRVISFSKPGETVDRVRFNIYYSTGTVGTCINHPRQGRTQLFRRNVTLHDLKAIFSNPRVHTGAGYHRAKDSQGTSSARRTVSLGSFPVGSRAYVKGYANCTILSNVVPYGHHHGGKIKIRYDAGTEYHVEPEQLEEIMEEVTDEETATRQQMKVLESDKREIEEQMSQLQNMLDTIEKDKRQKEEQVESARENVLQRISV